jgi:hypothetical protein
MSSLIKNIIIVLVLAGLSFFGYKYLTRTATPEDAIVKQDSTNMSKMGAEVLVALNQLKTLKLDESVFKDKTFISLKDFSKPLGTEPIGRINPFYPIGVENNPASKLKGASSTSATSSNTNNNRSNSATSSNNSW